MPKSKITFEFDGEVTPLEADKFILITMNDGNVTVTRHRISDSESLGLLQIGGWHVKKEWYKANKE